MIRKGFSKASRPQIESHRQKDTVGKEKHNVEQAEEDAKPVYPFRSVNHLYQVSKTQRIDEMSIVHTSMKYTRHSSGSHCL